MGVEHERIIWKLLLIDPSACVEFVQPHPDWQPCRKTGTAPHNTLVNVAAGAITAGKNKTGHKHYGWDNEYGLHSADIAAFQASKYLVSNQEFLPFVEANGYHTESYWQEEGRSWQKFTQAEHHTFWIKKGDAWYLRLMNEEVPMPWDWPVEVNIMRRKHL